MTLELQILSIAGMVIATTLIAVTAWLVSRGQVSRYAGGAYMAGMGSVVATGCGGFVDNKWPVVAAQFLLMVIAAVLFWKWRAQVRTEQRDA